MSERLESKRDGSSLQKNSGRGKHQKGDAVLGDFLIDYKEYPKGISVTTAMWAKICRDSIQEGKEPALKLVLGEGQGKVRLFVIAEDMFHIMYSAYEEVTHGEV